MVVGRAHGCARAGDGSVRCWGDYTGGGPIASDRAYVVQVPPVSALVAADTYTCALAAGEVWCWGSTPMQLDVEASHRTSHSLFGSSRHAYYPSPAHPIWD